MPLVPLYDASVAADAWHRVSSPGGYEWWHFDAEDAGGELRFCADFFDGFLLDRSYLSAYARYRRCPTRTAPPLPRQFPCVRFTLHRGLECLTRFTSQDLPITPLEAMGIASGSSRFTREPDGSIQVSLHGRDAGRGQVEAMFQFKPRSIHAPVQRALLTPAANPSSVIKTPQHFWITARPDCLVSGTISFPENPSPAAAREVKFSGRGYHDQSCGTGPPSLNIKRWIRGRVLLPDSCVIFSIVSPADGGMPQGVYLSEIDASQDRAIPAPTVVVEGGLSSSNVVQWPRRIAIGDYIRLQNPQPLDVSPLRARVIFDAAVRGIDCQALCEVL